jgi:hypothetical protein
MKDEILDCRTVTRVEVIDENGRAYVRHNLDSVKISVQDDGRTIKLFVHKLKTKE